MNTSNMSSTFQSPTPSKFRPSVKDGVVGIQTARELRCTRRKLLPLLGMPVLLQPGYLQAIAAELSQGLSTGQSAPAASVEKAYDQYAGKHRSVQESAGHTCP